MAIVSQSCRLLHLGGTLLSVCLSNPPTDQQLGITLPLVVQMLGSGVMAARFPVLSAHICCCWLHTSTVTVSRGLPVVLGYPFGRTILAGRGSLAPGPRVTWYREIHRRAMASGPGPHATRYRENHHGGTGLRPSHQSRLDWWRGQFQRHQKANVSVARFCRQLGVSVVTFSYWRMRVHEADSGTDSSRATVGHRSRKPLTSAGGTITNFVPVSAFP